MMQEDEAVEGKEGDAEMRQEGEEEHEEPPPQEVENGGKAPQSESDPLKLPPHGTEVGVFAAAPSCGRVSSRCRRSYPY